jgi:hypothetical protein
MYLAYNIAVLLTIARIRAILISGGRRDSMIIATTIDISPEVYRYFLHLSDKMENTSPEKLMSIYLTEYVRNIQKKEG